MNLFQLLSEIGVLFLRNINGISQKLNIFAFHLGYYILSVCFFYLLTYFFTVLNKNWIYQVWISLVPDVTDDLFKLAKNLYESRLIPIKITILLCTLVHLFTYWLFFLSLISHLELDYLMLLMYGRFQTGSAEILDYCRLIHIEIRMLPSHSLFVCSVSYFLTVMSHLKCKYLVPDGGCIFVLLSQCNVPLKT